MSGSTGWRDGAPRVGVFGLFGSGNLGNDGSLEALLTFLRREHPDAVVSCLCADPEHVAATHGVDSAPLHWFRTEHRTLALLPPFARKVAGRLLDGFRTLAWVRRNDVVIVPGMGVLEATVPLRPWAFPYSLLCLCASGRLVGTRVALVSVGADVVRKRVTRWVITRAARFAHYRSYRDAHSREAMREMGVDVGRDEVYPDLAFALPAPQAVDRRSPFGAVGVGVMAYYGGNDERGRAAEIHSSYVDTMKRFVRWLVDGGRQVRLLTGDGVDEVVVADILADLRTHRPGLAPSRVVAVHTATLHDLMRQMAVVDTVVATRYHNVLCAVKLAKPTLSVGYAAKNDALMAAMGLREYCQSARSVDLGRLIEQFQALEGGREQLVHTMMQGNRAAQRRLDLQFAALNAALFRPAGPDRVSATVAGGAS